MHRKAHNAHNAAVRAFDFSDKQGDLALNFIAAYHISFHSSACRYRPISAGVSVSK